jgi:pimeloyl-ACP methyl ester carboxylesterase
MPLGLVSCASTTDGFEQAIAANGLVTQTLHVREFRLLSVHKPGHADNDRLHVYLSGDGTPWIRQRWVATDPTPREPVALNLMVRDSAEAVYLGRPCYHHIDPRPPCDPTLWTSHRYGETVVATMTSALRQMLGALPGPRRVTLIGYSGGGVLAMLIAQRLSPVDRVVTIAANLDIDAWTRHHGYSALAGSLNPAELPALPPAVEQLHLVGGRDQVVPPALTAAAAAIQPGAVVVTVADFDHHCCWEGLWGGILGMLESPDPNCPAMVKKIPAAACRPGFPGAAAATTTEPLNDR